MGSFYDRLGDLLSDTLRNGKLPHEEDTDTAESSESPVTFIGNSDIRRAQRILNGNRARPRGSVIHTGSEDSSRIRTFAARELVVPDAVRSAFDVLGVPSSSSVQTVHDAYRTRLKYYHPDSNISNETVQKIAKEKTQQLNEAYSIVTAWLEKNNTGK
jgi:hypothetical protein